MPDRSIIEALMGSQPAQTFMQAISQLPSGLLPEQTPMASKVLQGVAQGALDWAKYPGQVAQSTTPINTADMTDWGAQTALNMVGAPMSAGGVPGMGAGIRAYHGSPYDFDKFDLSKIGTGEGAQAYGHGLYFAENPEVAKSYRDMLASSGVKVKQGFEYDPTELGILNRVIQQHGAENAPRVLQEQEALYRSRGEPIADSIKRAREALETGNYSPMPPGRMYEVSINAEPHQFLDWDKPIHRQEPIVTKALEDAYPGMIEARTAPDKSPTIASAFPYGIRSQISEALNKSGIPGIKYLDQGSRNLNAQILSPAETVHGQWLVKHIPNGDVLYRGPSEEAAKAAYEAAPKPTRNYVVFNPEIIDILRKWGLAGVPAAGSTIDLLSQQLTGPNNQGM